MNYDKKFHELNKNQEPRELAKLVLIHLKKSCSVIIDAGCGSGNDTLFFINEGFEVKAIDRETSMIDEIKNNLEENQFKRLTVINNDFTNMEFPKCDLFYSAYSLPFCNPEYFDRMWRNIVNSIKPQGIVAIVLFGEKDEWRDTHDDKSFHTQKEIERLLLNFEVITLNSQQYKGTCMDYDGNIVPKYWHVYNIIARLK